MQPQRLQTAALWNNWSQVKHGLFGCRPFRFRHLWLPVARFCGVRPGPATQGLKYGFSTPHTNDAPTTLTRMMNMGVAPFNIASSVILITAQRLARRLCTGKAPVKIPEQASVEAGFREQNLDGSWQAYKPGGCERCKNSGYKGRVGISPRDADFRRNWAYHIDARYCDGYRRPSRSGWRANAAPAGAAQSQAKV